MKGFSSETKSELAQVRPTRPCCRRAELTALMHAAGSIRVSGIDGVAIVMKTDHGAIARKIMTLFREVFGFGVEVILEKRPQLRRGHTFRIEVPAGEPSRRVLNELEILDRMNHLDEGVPPNITRNECCRWSFLRGAFLGAGSLADPSKGTYHLEFVSESPDFAEGLFYMLSLGRLKAKMSVRKQTHVVYLKESASIIRLLSQLGACHAVLQIEDLRVMKEMRGDVNRRVNAETANLFKAAESGADQAKMIADLTEAVGMSNLPQSVREFALARLDNPELSLRELGALMNPPVGKSAMNHRLRKLRQLWEENVFRPEP